MVINAVIPTRNNYAGVNDLAESLLKIKQRFDNLIVVDDSTDGQASRQLRAVCDSFEYLNFKVVGNPELEKLKMSKSVGLEGILVLGTPKWNLANARNIGMLYSYALSGARGFTVFLDDDMIAPRTFKLDETLLKSRKQVLGQIGIRGSPDLSRLEWVEYYLKISAPHLPANSDYVNHLFSMLNGSSEAVLSSFTDLAQEKKAAPVQRSFVPSREELSGGAFVCSNALISVSLFPSWFDEDWFWFEMARYETGITQKDAGAVLYHNASKKKILMPAALEFEEDGKLLTNAAKDYCKRAEYQKRTGRVSSLNGLIETHKQKRIALLKNILEKTINSYTSCGGHKGNHCGASEITSGISKSVKGLLSYIENSENSRYENQLRSFIEVNRLWRKNLTLYAKDVLKSQHAKSYRMIANSNRII